MQKEEISNLITKLENIKKMGYIPSYNNNRGKETTLYNLLSMNSHDNFIISCKNIDSNNYITIFNATPIGKEKNQLKRLKEKYGFYDNMDFKNKVFKCSIQSSFSTFIKSNYLLKLHVNYQDAKIYLQIYDKNYNLIDNKTYWSFDMLQKYYTKKAKYLILVKTWLKKENNINYYKYYDFSIYELKDFNDFLKLIDEGIIRITFRVNHNTKPNRQELIKDDGTSFELQEMDLLQLYTKIC